MAPSTIAVPAGNELMEPQYALITRRSKPLHPFNLSFLHCLLCNTSLFSSYPTVLSSFSQGFVLGVLVISYSFQPNNSASVTSLSSEFQAIVNKEFQSQHYIGPFNKSELQALIEPFQSSPLSLVPKPNSSKFCLIQNLSYPLTPHPIPSINSFINSQDFPCTFGTFFNVCFIINNLPSGSQASTRDVADAYRTIPLHYSQWPGLVMKLQDNVFALNTQNSFGLASTSGVWGHVANMFADFFRSQGFGPITKWVDDFLFFCIPNTYLPLANHYRTQLSPQLSFSQYNARRFFEGPALPDGTVPQYDENFHFPLKSLRGGHFAYNGSDIDSLSESLGLPWKHNKSTSFSNHFTYLGFNWNLTTLTVSLQHCKQTKYLNAILQWLQRPFYSLLQVQSLYGKLLHATYIVPQGRLYLTGLEKMIPTFSGSPNRPHQPAKNIQSELEWWKTVLSAEKITRSIPNFLSYSYFHGYSDASHSGIAVVIGTAWATFQFTPQFK